MRDAVALFVLVLQLPIPVFWLVIHPTVEFWRRSRRAYFLAVGATVWFLGAVLLLGWRHWWLADRFSRHPLVALAGVALIGVDIWLIRRVEHQAGWRVLVGLPELQSGGQRGRVVAGGVYDRVRHPRYLGMMMAWLGAALLSGATRLLLLVMVFIGLAVVVTELEERELLRRLGSEYADYRRRVPRFLPRWREPEERPAKRQGG